MTTKAPEAGVFRRTYPLAYPDADAAGYVRLTSVLNLLQIHAGEHTQSLGFDYREHRENGVYWVLSRLMVRFESWPQWPCDFTMDTWTRSTKALFALRDFRFGVEGEPWCGRASSAWVVLKDRKPQRPEPWVQIYTQISPEVPLSAVPPALPAFRLDPEAEARAEPLYRQARGVRASWDDLDMNAHVNNVNAVGWCLAQHDFAFLSRWRPATLEVTFLAEMFCDQSFQILRDELPSSEGSRCFDYVVVREDDQVPTLRLRVTFR